MPDDTVLLERHFDTAFAAPNGIQKLRELILTLAMQGKLVPQDPKDQPASELLKEIEAEKQRLVKEKRIGKPNTLSGNNLEEVPYKLPKGWEWVILEQLVTKIGSGSTPRGGKEAYVIDGIPFLRSQNIWNSGLRTDDVAFISEETHRKMAATTVMPMDILLNITGASLGRCAIIPGEFEEANVSQHVTIIRCVNPETRRFIHYLILSPYGQSMIWTRQVGMSREGLSKKVLEQFQIPLPPLAQQHRIVSEIDRLMARCDELEKLRAERNQKRITVHTAALDRLLNAKESDNFSTAWHFITQHFGELYSVKENVAELRKAILQLAVMGKLVPQDPTDEPASELLRAIAAEKQQLVKDGKIKHLKALPEIADEEKEFMLPLGWEWSRLQDVLDVRDGTHDSPQDANGLDTYPLVTSKNFVSGKIDFSSARQISANDHFEIVKRSKVDKLDILFSMIGGNIGNQVIVEEERDFSIKNVALFKYYNKQLTYPYFIKRYLEHLAHGLQEKAAGGAQPFVSLGFLRHLVIALPPKEEQYRIVAKLNQLMSLCDHLDQQIDAARGKQADLLNAVMA